MDLMDDDDLKKSVINQMMGELDDVTSSSLKKAPATKGVEISIMVAPKGDEDMDEDGEESPAEEECGVEGCEDPMHNHPPMEAKPDESDYISELLKKMG